MAEMERMKKLNGVDVGQLIGTIDAVRKNPDLAHFKFRAETEWLGGARSRTQVQGFYGVGQEDMSRTKPFTTEGDEPAVLLGSNTAPNAVEAVLHAIASCLTVGMVYNAAARGIEIESLSFSLEGDLDLHSFLGLDGSRAGYEDIRITYHIKSSAPREQIEELCDYVQKTSPVLDIVRNPVPVSVTLAD